MTKIYERINNDVFLGGQIRLLLKNCHGRNNYGLNLNRILFASWCVVVLNTNEHAMEIKTESQWSRNFKFGSEILFIG